MVRGYNKVTNQPLIRSNMLEEENNLIRQAQEGDKDAFGKLYDHYLPKIYRFILLKVTNKSEAEDLTHEVFLNAWQKINSFTPRGFPFSSWVYRIAKNEVIDFYRTNKNNMRLEQAEENFLKIPETQSRAVNQSLDLEKIKNLLHLLKPDQQDVLIMRFVEGLSHQEISAAINKSEGAVRIIQYRAIQNLKEIINQNNENNNSNIKEA